MDRSSRPIPQPRGVLGALRRDVRGNTLAVMAAAMVPIIGFAGSAIDMGRLYVVKVRLQQACDAGVLAGRKGMTDNALTTPLDNTAKKQAQDFFANNFKSGLYRSTAVSFTPTKGVNGTTSTVANAVNGTATATVPMTLMQFFKVQPATLNVTCQAVFDLADTDVMFVLDTTGSMSCYPSDPADCANGSPQPYSSGGSTGYANVEKPAHTLDDGTTEYSRIESLRRAVMLFDTTMRANADPTTHFRYGFVTYSSAVNVGGIIPAQYLQSGTWTYQSRHLSPVNNGGAIPGDYAFGGTSSVSVTGVPQALCVTQRMPATGFAKTGLTWSDQGYYQARSYYNLSWTAANGGTCSGTQQPLRPYWRYEPVSLDISQYSAFQTVTTPGRFDGLTSKWRGCIEEVDTSAATSFDVNALPDDLDPDFAPTDSDNKWRPAWPDAEWLRNPYASVGYTDVKDEAIDEGNIDQYEDYTYRADSILDRSGSASCGMPAKWMKTPTASDVSNYVHDANFRPFGGTYHDTGMIWGTRMLSPDGIFKSNTAPWPGRNDPSRSIVFMTDGGMKPSLTSYGQYGVEAWDNRVTATDWGSQLDRHNARFRVECDAAKKKGITIYVVAVAVAANADLTYCASPGQVFEANSTDKLTAAFASIAKRIAQLRITK